MNIENIAGNTWYYLRKENSLKEDKSGKWMYYFDAKSELVAEQLCIDAISNNIVELCCRTGSEELKIEKIGMICFYLNFDDIERHKKVIQFFINNNLISKTKAGRYTNISFLLDGQTKGFEYRSNYKKNLTLSEFINLGTGEFIV